MQYGSLNGAERLCLFAGGVVNLNLATALAEHQTAVRSHVHPTGFGQLHRKFFRQRAGQTQLPYDSRRRYSAVPGGENQRLAIGSPSRKDIDIIILDQLDGVGTVRIHHPDGLSFCAFAIGEIRDVPPIRRIRGRNSATAYIRREPFAPGPAWGIQLHFQKIHSPTLAVEYNLLPIGGKIETHIVSPAGSNLNGGTAFRRNLPKVHASATRGREINKLAVNGPYG